MTQSRRQILKSGLAGVVAIGGAATTLAQSANRRPSGSSTAPAVTSGRMNGPLFFDVDTSGGVVRGTVNTGVKIFRGISLSRDLGPLQR